MNQTARQTLQYIWIKITAATKSIVEVSFNMAMLKEPSSSKMAHAMGYIKLRSVLLCLYTSVSEFKKWKKVHYLFLVNRSSSFFCIAHTRILLWTKG